MRTSRRTIVATMGAVAIVAGIGATVAAATNTTAQGEQRSEESFTEAHRAEARVSQSDAERSALVARPGTIVESHLETEGHGLRWEVKTKDGAQVWEVQLDPTTGAVVSNQVGE